MISIYKITHNETGKCYIGQAVDVQKRWREHSYKSSRCKKLSRAIQKYGVDAFDFKVLFECDPEVADINETVQIARHNSIENGYNICPQGRSRRGVKFSEETKQKMSAARKGEKNPMYSKTHSEETKNKMSDALKGEKNHRYGKTHSDETKQKMSNAQKGEKSHNSKLSDAQREEIKALYATGEYSLRKLAKLYSVHYTTISNIIRGKVSKIS